MSSLYKAFFGLILFQSNFSFSQGKIIMNGTATMQMKNAVYVVTKDVSLTNASALNVDNSTIKIAGTITSYNNIDVQTGTVEMNGPSAQTIPGNSFTANKIKNLIISNQVTLAGQDSLTGILSFGNVNSKTFFTGGFLTLKSTAAATAVVADLTNDNTNSGNQVLGDVTAERYLSAIKKWRFLSIPTATNQTIQSAWQEGSMAPNDNLIAGYGTQITGAGGTSNGFDVYTATPSMKTYNTTTDTWVAVPATKTTSINNISNNTIAYMLFVRGDRTATAYNSPVTSTVLRTKGVIKQGVQSVITIASPATAFTAVGNPYPSRIDLRRMTPAPTTATKIYVWDPLATIGSAYGLGAYQTLTYNLGEFTVTPGGGSYAAPYNKDPNYIESGEAFFVGGDSTSYTITFREDIKPSVGSLISTPMRLRQNLVADLFINSNSTTLLMDGAKADIGANFSAVLDGNDAYKILNSSENVSFKRNGKLLSVERYRPIAENDTFYLNLSNLKVQKYQWRLSLNNLEQAGLTAFLEDKYANTSTPVSLNGSTTVNFSVESIPGSYAPGRFYLVFNEAKVLALTFTNVTAYQQNKAINVEWNVANESDIKLYEVEKSMDGNQYAKVSVANAKNLPLSEYKWRDEDALAGYNYYRIKSVDISGKVEYSKVVKVFVGSAKQAITVYPNPVKDGVINVQMLNQPAGSYEIKLLNIQGQAIITRTIQHANGNNAEIIPLKKGMAKGIYTLQITTPTAEIINNKLIY